MHLYDYLDSGNGYKVRLLLAQLGQKYDWTDVDIDKGQTRTPEFLKRMPDSLRTLFLGKAHWGRNQKYRQLSDPVDTKAIEPVTWN